MEDKRGVDFFKTAHTVIETSPNACGTIQYPSHLSSYIVSSVVAVIVALNTLPRCIVSVRFPRRTLMRVIQV